MLCARRRRRFSADLMQSVANEGRGATLPREIPNIAGDYTIRATNATHFTKCPRWIRNEVNRKSGNDDIEGVIRERQLLRVRNAEIRSFRDWFLARKFDLWLRRIDRDDCSRKTRTDYNFGKDSSATTDIEPARINAQFGRYLLAVTNPLESVRGSVVEAASMGDLVRLAQHSGRMILHSQCD